VGTEHEQRRAAARDARRHDRGAVDKKRMAVTHLQIGCVGADALPEKAVGHRTIENAGCDSPMNHARVTFMASIETELSRCRATVIEAKDQPQSVRIGCAADKATWMLTGARQRGWTRSHWWIVGIVQVQWHRWNCLSFLRRRLGGDRWIAVHACYSDRVALAGAWRQC